MADRGVVGASNNQARAAIGRRDGSSILAVKRIIRGVKHRLCEERAM